MPVLAPDITDRWLQADGTANHLEAAQTEVPGLYAIRDTYDRSRVVFATDEQIQAFADRVNDPNSDLGRMLSEGRSRNGQPMRQRDRDGGR